METEIENGCGETADAGPGREQLAAYWMPFTGNRQFKSDPRIIVGAQGNYFTTADGRRIFDGLSGLWCCGAGHARPEIVEAIREQAARLDYAPAFQYGHPAAFELAHRIADLMPDELNRVFFTCSGSESADTSLKIARACWRKRGRPAKTRLIGRAKAYHGVNFGGTGVGGIGANRGVFGQSIDADHLSHTMTADNRFSMGMPSEGAESADELVELIALHEAENIAAVIVEPMSGSGGVIPPPKGYLKRLREICDAHEILLIFDEVITAFGRIGSATASEAFGVLPDILTVAKQLTNGTVPMGAVVVRQGIYDTFMENGGPHYALELPHGYTYSGHPVACAAALATLRVLESDDLYARVRTLAPILERSIHGLRGTPHVTDIRNCGLAAGLTLEAAAGEPLLRPFKVAMSLWEKGFYVRYGGDTIQLGPPFTSTPEEIHTLVSALDDSLRKLD